MSECVDQVTAEFPEIKRKTLEKWNKELIALREKYKNDITSLRSEEKKWWDNKFLHTELRRQRANDNAFKAVQITERINAAKSRGNKSIDAIQGMYEQSLKPGESARDSISMSYKVNLAESANMLDDALSNKQLKQFTSPEYDSQTATAMFELETQGKVITKTIPKEVQEVAAIYVKFNNHIVRMLRAAGIQVGQIAGYIMRQTHDPTKLIAGGKNVAESFKAWASEILPRLDLEKTFGEFSQDSATQMRILRSTFDKIIDEGDSHGYNRFTEGRSLHFKNPQAFIEYNSLYGRSSSILESMFEVSRSASRHAAMTRFLGTSDQWGQRLKQLMNSVDNENDKAKIRTLHQMALGYDERVGMSRGARIASNTRTVISFAKMAKSAFAAMNDWVSAAFAVKSLSGKGLIETTFDNLFTWINTLDPEVRRNAAKDYALNMEHTHNHQISRTTGEMNMAEFGKGFWAWTNKNYFTLNLLGPLTRMSKTTTAIAVGESLKKVINSKKLTESQDLILKSFDISEIDIKNLRLIDDDVISGATIEKLDLNKITVPLRKGEKKPRTPEQYIKDLKHQVIKLINDFSEMGAPTPGKAESRIFSRHLDPDTIKGQGVRFFSQFKMTPTKMFRDSVYLARLNGGNNKIAMAQWLGARIALGAASVLAIDMLKTMIEEVPKALWTGELDEEEFKKRLPMYDSTTGEWRLRKGAVDMMELAARGGGLGITGDYIFGRANKYGDTAFKNLAGPVLGEAWEVKKMTQDFIDGKPISKRAFNFMIYNTPYLGLPFISSLRQSIIDVTNQYLEEQSPEERREARRRRRLAREKRRREKR